MEKTYNWDVMNITKMNEVFVRVDCEESLAQSLSDYFTFMVPGHEFMPAYRRKVWDGKIRLFNIRAKTLYIGLLPYLRKFAKENNATIKINEKMDLVDEFSLYEAKEFAQSLNLPFEPRDYQLTAFVHAARYRRCLLLSPTASGKSLIIYLLTRFIQGRVLILVPTVSLVSQMQKDFRDYGYEGTVHEIMAGAEKITDERVVISTWQSIYKLPADYFKQFDAVIGDEAHLYKSKSLSKIMTNLENTKYRVGLTGTLDGTETHQLVLEGLFGPVYKVTETSKLMERKQLADFRIKALVLEYPEGMRRLAQNYKYNDEIDFLVSNEKRNAFIRNLALSLEGNTLILYQYVDRHGAVLYEDIKNRAGSRSVSFIHGGVASSDREEVRSVTEKEKDGIIIASFGTFSTGINIRNLHNIIFASPSKSKVRVLQSIGRALRLGENKEVATLYDIVDDLSYKSNHNYTLNHFIERMKIYNQEKFVYRIYNIKMGEQQ